MMSLFPCTGCTSSDSAASRSIYVRVHGTTVRTTGCQAGGTGIAAGRPPGEISSDRRSSVTSPRSTRWAPTRLLTDARATPPYPGRCAVVSRPVHAMSPSPCVPRCRRSEPPCPGTNETTSRRAQVLTTVAALPALFGLRRPIIVRVRRSSPARLRLAPCRRTPRSARRPPRGRPLHGIRHDAILVSHGHRQIRSTTAAHQNDPSARTWRRARPQRSTDTVRLAGGFRRSALLHRGFGWRRCMTARTTVVIAGWLRPRGYL